MLAACGGGGGVEVVGSAPPVRTVTLKLATTGTASAAMGGIGISIVLPAGVTPLLNTDGTVGAAVVVVSGVATPGTVAPPAYVAASGATQATLQFVMASTAPAGFPAGEFATLVLNLAGTTTPVSGDFILSGFIPTNILGNPVTGLTTEVSS